MLKKGRLIRSSIWPDKSCICPRSSLYLAEFCPKIHHSPCQTICKKIKAPRFNSIPGCPDFSLSQNSGWYFTLFSYSRAASGPSRPTASCSFCLPNGCAPKPLTFNTSPSIYSLILSKNKPSGQQKSPFPCLRQPTKSPLMQGF